MTIRNYQRQHLALWAAGYINGAGTTRITFGCGLTRIGVGQYGLTTDASHGLFDNETFTIVSMKGGLSGWKVVADTTAFLKTIRTFNDAGSPTDRDIEVALFRSVAYPK